MQLTSIQETVAFANTTCSEQQSCPRIPLSFYIVNQTTSVAIIHVVARSPQPAIVVDFLGIETIYSVVARAQEIPYSDVCTFVSYCI